MTKIKISVENGECKVGRRGASRRGCIKDGNCDKLKISRDDV